MALNTKAKLIAMFDSAGYVKYKQNYPKLKNCLVQVSCWSVNMAYLKMCRNVQVFSILVDLDFLILSRKYLRSLYTSMEF